MKLLKSSVLLITALTASQSALADNNLINNGSFEQSGNITGTWKLFNELPGWQRSGARFEIQTNRLGLIQPQEGSQYLELDSTSNYSAFQTIATEAGKRYTISFYYSPRVTSNGQTNQATVSWDGQVVANLNGTSRGWQHITVTVTANTAQSTLTFSGSGTSDSYGALIDNVSVTADCVTGLFGINNFGDAGNGYIFNFDVENGTYSKVSGVSHTASNIASKDGVLYFMEQNDKSTKASTLWSLDLDGNVESALANATSWPIYRSAVSDDGLSLRATSKTYMYDYDLTTGAKTVLGKLKYEGDNFSHGDIAYSADNNVLYVLTGKALYTLDTADMTLTEIGKHGVNWASGLAISDDGTLYVSGRQSGQNAKIYTLNPNTGVATYVMDGPEHINDLTFVDNYCR
ncbi:hemolysin-type calcium-binding protein [Pseudoalteromonas luteoviolacea]|nr:hemolysin-type calcium-binding protein [Pseudoalteromonas luteoviolacea]